MLVIRGVSELGSWKSVAFASCDSKPHARSCPVAWNKFRSLWAVTSFHGSWSWAHGDGWSRPWSWSGVWTVDKGPHNDSVHPTATPWEWDTGGGATAMLCVPCLLPELLDKHGAKRRWAVTSGCWGLGRLGLKKRLSVFLT